MATARKPKPKTLTIVCSECGLDWKLHKTKELTECVRLLKAEVSKARSRPLVTQSASTAYPTWFAG